MHDAQTQLPAGSQSQVELSFVLFSPPRAEDPVRRYAEATLNASVHKFRVPRAMSHECIKSKST